MWGAIIQAIDHALGRMNEGASAGIKVAKSQSGGAAPATNMSSDAGSSAAQDVSNIAKNNDTESEATEAVEKAKIGSNSTSEGSVPSSSKGGNLGGALGNIGSIGGGDAGSSAGDAAGGVDASAAADAAGSIVSDENTKSAKDVSSDKKKDKSKAADTLGAIRSYSAGVGQGFANAGAIATGNGAAAEWKDIDTSKAREAAEDTVKSWQKQRQEANKEQKPATTAEGK